MDNGATREALRVAGVCSAPGAASWSFAVERGGAIWIPDGRESGLAWLDWLTGIEPPAAGEVFWKGVEWRRRGADEAAAERGRIGCVFADGGLVANLNMDENVWLPLRMHRRAGAEAQVERWARFFGCWPLPQERGPKLPEALRRRILWTRAFAVHPELLVLERPLRDSSPEDCRLFLNAIGLARGEGCAAVWLDDDLSAETRATLEPLADATPEPT